MINNILNRLEKVRQTKSNEWVASCPLHTDNIPSLGIMIDDGKIVMNCFSCHETGVAVIECIGMEVSDLFPPRENNQNYTKQKRKYLSDSTILEVIAYEATILSLAVADIGNRREWTIADLNRVKQAGERIEKALNYRNR